MITFLVVCFKLLFVDHDIVLNQIQVSIEKSTNFAFQQLWSGGCHQHNAVPNHCIKQH
jgi:hypothetical protein